MSLSQVRSRFANARAEGEDFRPFLRCLQQLGFKLHRQDTSDKMFVVFELRKGGKQDDGGGSGGGSSRKAPPLTWPDLKPCIYKRR